jgi:hypothetical protein
MDIGSALRIRTAPQVATRRRLLAGTVAVLAVVSLGAAAFSLAQFTDSKDAAGTFSTGTIVLGVSPTTVFTVSATFPGASGSQTVTVSNSGTGALRYALTTAATNVDGKGLATAVQLTVKTGTCPAAAGTQLYSGAVGSAAFGDPFQGPDTGDRNLAATASEDLCFAWSLPLSTGNGLQNAATTATFTFAAEQTANNP